MGFFDLTNVPDVGKETRHMSYDCSHCQLFKHCQTPKIAPFGGGNLGILVVGGAVELASENSKNAQQGSHYLYLKKRLKQVGISLEKDCWYVPAIRCYSNKDKYGLKTLGACASLLQADIKRLKPKVVVVTDELGWDVLLSNRMLGSRGDGSLWDYAGATIPDQELKTWVLPLTPTHHLLSNEREMAKKKADYGEHYTPPNRFEPHYRYQLEAIAETINKPFPTLEWESKIRVASSVDEACHFLSIVNTWDKFAFDYETTGLAWHNPVHQIHCVSFSDGNVSYAMLWYPDNPKFMKTVREVFTNDAIKIAHNKAFERSWTIGRAGVEPTNLTHDPMLMAHVWRNLAPTGLKFCLYREFGILGYDEDTEEYLKPPKAEERKYGKNAVNRIFHAPVNKILKYVSLDSLFTYWLARHYLQLLDKDHMLPGYKLLARAERPLTHMHLTGLRVDMDKLREWKPILQKKIDDQYAIIMDSDFIRNKWRGANRFNPSSDPDVRYLLFDILKLKPLSFTDKGLPSVDADALEDYRADFPVAENLLEYRRWYKCLNSFLAGIEREQWDGVLHFYFSLNNVDSYRSGSQRINLQNIPKHDKEVMNVIRSILKPRHGHKLTSCDYAQLEVRANASISGDPNLKKAVEGDLDMHSAMALKLFILTEDEKKKPTRQTAKTQVFRLFYGGSGMQMAEATWKQLCSAHQDIYFGMNMKSHLQKKGIHTLAQWTEHCVRVEKWLWGELFPAYQEWRKATYKEYLETGKLYYPNGFTYQGIASRNSLLNGPGQGAGFHVNLNAICGIFEELEAKKMDTKLVVEIHDDVMGDVLPEEEEEYKKILYKHMVAMKNDYSPWLGSVPLEIEYGHTEVDGSWADMETVGVLHF